MDDINLEIMRQGKVDYFLDKGNYRNPYKYGTPEFDAYERGWFQSQKAAKKPPSPATGYQAPLSEKYKNIRDWSQPNDDD